MKLYRAGKLLPRGQIFTLFEDDHREGMILLFESLLYSLDFDTFLRTAVWARDRINEGQFVYALSVAVLHREDTKGVVLPPPYEIYPHLFVNSEVIINAYKSKMRQEPKIVYSNFTGEFIPPLLIHVVPIAFIWSQHLLFTFLRSPFKCPLKPKFSLRKFIFKNIQ